MTRNKKKVIGKKGNLFFDEGANKKLINPTQYVGYKVHGLPPELKNTQISDEKVADYAKGMPIVTEDYTAYKEGGVKNKATAYIQHEVVSTDTFDEYAVKWQTFLSNHSSKTLKGYTWKVPLKGEITKKKLSQNEK